VKSWKDVCSVLYWYRFSLIHLIKKKKKKIAKQYGDNWDSCKAECVGKSILEIKNRSNLAKVLFRVDPALLKPLKLDYRVVQLLVQWWSDCAVIAGREQTRSFL